MSDTPRTDAARLQAQDHCNVEGPDVALDVALDAMEELERELAQAVMSFSETQSAVDHVDLMCDEFRRIAACSGADSEIRQLCLRAIERTHRNVPVVAELEAAQGELRAVRSYAELQTQALRDIVAICRTTSMHVSQKEQVWQIGQLALAALTKDQCGGSGSLSETPRPSTAHPLPAGLKPEKQLDGGPSASGPATQPEPRTIVPEIARESATCRFHADLCAKGHWVPPVKQCNDCPTLRTQSGTNNQRQGADSPCAEVGSSAPSTGKPDPASQGGPSGAPSDERHGAAQSAPATNTEESRPHILREDSMGNYYVEDDGKPGL